MTKGYKHYVKSTINAQLRLNQDFSSVIKGLEGSILFNVQRYAYSANSRAYQPFYYEAIPLTNNSVIGSSNGYRLKLINPTSGTNYLGYTPLSKTVTSRFYLQGQANYVRTFGKNNGVNAFLVFSARNQTYDNVTTLEASLPHRNVNFAGRITYDYNHIYYLELNFGLNASERFAKNNRWGFFPSIGVAWNIANEKFWKPIHSVISKLKLRFSYGFSGNDNIGPNSHRFAYLSQVNLDDAAYSFITGTTGSYELNGVFVKSYPNFGITWEEAKKINIGINFGLFNKLNMKANIYYQDRTDILQDRKDLPASLGLSYIPEANIGEAKSHGFSTHLVYYALLNNNWSLQVRGNFTYGVGKYVKYSEPTFVNAPNRSHIGVAIGQQFGLIAERLFIDEADIENSPKQEFGPYGPGDIKYLDVNGDGKITNLDKVPMGYPLVPEVNYGFGFTSGFKNFDLSVFFEGLARESFWINVSDSNTGTAPYVDGHILLKAYANNHWSPKNEKLTPLYPHFSTKYVTKGQVNNEQRSTWFMRNGAFLRLKEVQIGYTLPNNITSKLSMRSLRIYLTGRNLMHFSPFKLWDPEMAGKGLGYPLQQTFSIGINARF